MRQKKDGWKTTIICIIIVYVIIVGINFLMVPLINLDKEHCLESQYTYWNESKIPKSFFSRFIPSKMARIFPCTSYAWREEIKICNNGTCYQDTKLVYKNKEWYEKYGK